MPVHQLPCDNCGADTKYDVVMYRRKRDRNNQKYSSNNKHTMYHIYLCDDCAEQFEDFMLAYIDRRCNHA